jgi:prepilin-type N-terminal cleavage/methylation domain-containing protein
MRTTNATRAFTLIELLVVIAIISLLVSITLPALAGARQSARNVACSVKMQQLGVAIQMYQNQWDLTLPQYMWDVDGQRTVIGALFGGKKGWLPAYGINQVGAARRPLNVFLDIGRVPSDDDEGRFEVEAFRSPCDKGGIIEGIGLIESMYDMVGSSYTLNDHDLRGERFYTLVPPWGGRMPPLVTPTKTWILASHTIYNHQAEREDGNVPQDRMLKWYGQKNQSAANMLFGDLHVGGPYLVPKAVQNTTQDYTFLPSPDWRRVAGEGGDEGPTDPPFDPPPGGVLRR